MTLRYIDNIQVETVPLPPGARPEIFFATVWVLKKGKKILGEYHTTFTDDSAASSVEAAQ